MPITKAIQAPSGASVEFHKAMQASVDMNTGTVSVNVASWSTDTDYLAGAGLTWMWSVELTLDALANLDVALTAVEPFDGGEIVSDPAVTLYAVKARAWAKIKDARNAAIYAGLLARAPSANWTAVEDGTATLSDDDVGTMGQVFGEWVNANLRAAAALRARIDGATTADLVKQAAWTPV
jgi:hypothetical protein